jgi:dihydroorotase
MNEGFYSMRLGLPGMPSIAETIFVERDIELADFTGGRLHVQNVTCGGSVESIRQAKKRGVRVTCEVAVHHLVLTDEVMAGYSAVYKVNPPLRTEDDRRALIEGLKDGTIDAIVSGHAPIATEDKQRELDQSPFGMIGIESLLPIVVKRLIDPGELNWLDAIRLMSTRPAEILKLNGGSLQPGARADLVVYDANVEWTIDPTKFRSKSRNCPFAGEQVRGRPAAVLINGEICQLA